MSLSLSPVGPAVNSPCDLGLKRPQADCSRYHLVDLSVVGTYYFPVVKGIVSLGLNKLLQQCGRVLASYNFPSGLKRLVEFEKVRAIEDLKEDRHLKACFSKKTGVWEGYTVEEHTILVLRAAERFRRQLEPMITPLITWEEFELFLCLHDIGKCAALEQYGKDKHKELEETRTILSNTLNARPGFDKNKIRLFVELLRYDTIGDFLKGKLPLETARLQITEMAQNANVDRRHFLNVFLAFNTADTASYFALMHSLFFVQDEQLVYRYKQASLLKQLY